MLSGKSAPYMVRNIVCENDGGKQLNAWIITIIIILLLL